MIRGTTPTINIKFPVAVSTITKIRIYFKQGSETVLVKDEDDCTFDGYIVSTTLSEEETYKFTSKKRVEINARFALTSGKVGGMLSKYVDVYDTGDPEEELLIDATEETTDVTD